MNESTWNLYPETKPKYNILCVVRHISRPNNLTLAIYHHDEDIFENYEPHSKFRYVLDVTHYLRIPG